MPSEKIKNRFSFYLFFSKNKPSQKRLKVSLLFLKKEMEMTPISIKESTTVSSFFCFSNKISKVSLKLQCLRLKDKGWKQEELADFLDVSIASITNWLKRYRNGGISTLLQWDYKGNVSILSLKEVEELQKRNKEKPF